MESKAKSIKWLSDRLPLGTVREFLDHKTVPVHSATRWYYFGGITLFLFVIQVVTGILLLFYYRPTVAEGFDSVRFIMTRVEFGWLIRSIHSWSANLLILVAFIHMFSVVFTHAYRPPRELTWLSGIVLLALMLGFGFQRLPFALEPDFILRHQSGNRRSRKHAGDWFHNRAIPAWRRGCWSRHSYPVLCAPRDGPAAVRRRVPGIASGPGPAEWHEHAAVDPSFGCQANEVLSELLLTGTHGLVRSAGRPGWAGGDVSLGTRGKG